MATIAIIFLVIIHLIAQTYAPGVVVQSAVPAGSKPKTLQTNLGPHPVSANGSVQPPVAQQPGQAPVLHENLSEKAKSFYKKHTSLLTPNVSKSDFKVLKHLSTGDDGSVYKVQRISDNVIFALKEIEIPAEEKFGELAEQVEIQVMATKDKRTHINNVIAVFLNENELCMILDFMKGDVNNSIFWKHPTMKFTELQFCGMTKGMISDLAYLEEKGISHRDLDTCNLFVNEKDEIVVGDFQRATKEREFSCRYHAHSYYAPPEWNKKRTDIKCTIKVDVWAIGVFLKKIKKHITDASDAFDNMLSPNAVFSEDPALRPSFSKMLSSQLFNQC